jgi:hypothetical protein
MRAVEFMRKMLDVFDAEEQAREIAQAQQAAAVQQPVVPQQPVVINIVNGGAPADAAPADQTDIEQNDPAQRVGANGQPIMTPPLQQHLDAVKASVNTGRAPMAAITRLPTPLG